MTKKIITTCDECFEECNQLDPGGLWGGNCKPEKEGIWTIMYENNGSPYLNITKHFCSMDCLFNYNNKAQERKNANQGQ